MAFFRGNRGIGGGGGSGVGAVKWVYESKKGTRVGDVTSVTVPSYDTVNDFLAVLVEGVEYNTSEYTKTDSTTITFTNPVPDTFDIIIRCFGSVNNISGGTKLKVGTEVTESDEVEIVGEGGTSVSLDKTYPNLNKIMLLYKKWEVM